MARRFTGDVHDVDVDIVSPYEDQSHYQHWCPSEDTESKAGGTSQSRHELQTYRHGAKTAKHLPYR